MKKVITWSTSDGMTIDVTPEAEAILGAAGVWPRSSRGEEYCRVMRGLHRGDADIDAELAREIVAGRAEMPG